MAKNIGRRFVSSLWLAALGTGCSAQDPSTTGVATEALTPAPPPAPNAPDGTGTSHPASVGTHLQWHKANLTRFTSYPAPGSQECIAYSGCEWAGQFAAVGGKQPESWVKANNIAAVHSKDFATYKLKTLRLKQGPKQIDVTVYDQCNDLNCNGCPSDCTESSQDTEFLIDLESYTAARFGASDGIVDWACLDCP